MGKIKSVLLYIAKTNVSQDNELLLSGLLNTLTDELCERVDGVKSNALRTDRIIAYSMLLSALKNAGKNPQECEILFTKEGKPYLKSQDIGFSISHTRGLVCVALFEGDIGVDAQAIDEISCERAKALSTRFFSDVHMDALDIPDFTDETNTSSLGVKIDLISTTYHLTDAGVQATYDKVKCVSGIDGPLRKWCECEALLKLDGRGFSALGDISKIAEGSLVFSTCVKSDKASLVHISLAISK